MSKVVQLTFTHFKEQPCGVVWCTTLYFPQGVGPHDANAIVHYKGVWHVFHQANWTDWAHLVSTDMVHWTRLPSALSPNGGP